MNEATTFVTGIDIIGVLPFIMACVFGTIVLMLEAFQRPSFDRGYIANVAAFGFLATGSVALLLPGAGDHVLFGGAAYLDGMTRAFTVLFCVAGFCSALMAPAYLKSHHVDRGEYYALLLFSAAGMMLMVAAGDLITFFVALEIQSVAIYALAGYLRRSPRSAEAGMKYFLIGAFATGILLYGIALVYGATGTTKLTEIGAMIGGSGASVAGLVDASQQAALVAAAGFDESVPAGLHDFGGMLMHVPLLSIGVVLIVVGFGIKLAAVPFHMWAPDVYTGSPTPIVGFMAAAVKVAGFGALVRIISLALFDGDLRMGPTGWVQVTFWMALLSMVVGNFAAVVQTNVKRMLAFSSVAHAGYLLVAVTAMGFASGDIGMSSGVVFYGFAYTFGTVGAFGVLAWLGAQGSEAETYEDLNGLGFRRPWLAVAMAIFMLSSAGIPPTAGFIGKLMLFQSAVDASAANPGATGAHLLNWLVVVGILSSVAGVYYYLRVIVHMYMKAPVRDVEELPSAGSKLAILACAFFTAWFGLFPALLVSYSNDAASQLLDRADDGYVVPVDAEE